MVFPLSDSGNNFTNAMNARVIADDLAFTLRLAMRCRLEDEAANVAQARDLYGKLAIFFAEKPAPVAVEEADAKAGEPSDLRGKIAAALRRSPYTDRFNYLAQADAVLAVLYTTPSPQIGKAGAGPVERLVEETGSSSVDDLRDMALVGHSLMNAIHHATKEGPYKDWTPAEDPAEIVSDLINDLEEAITRAERAEQFRRANGTARQAAEAALAETRERLEKVDRIRSLGWAVAVHNDYRLNGEAHTFWLFTKDGRAVKGEGRTDAEALAAVLAEIAALTGDAQEGGK